MKIFLDDIRVNDEGTILCKSVKEVVELINQKGFPLYISFDHDLGDNLPTGMDFVHIIVDNVLDGVWSIPNNFTFQVHSDNPVGSENIRNLMNNLLKEMNIPFKLTKCHPYSQR